MIRSYAQQAEDVRLARAFGSEGEGFYIDVGASHPVFDSVTKYFYDIGWHGIDIEPDPEAARLLREDRPHDLILELACSDRDGETAFYDSEAPGWSTVNPEVAARVAETRGVRLSPRRVPTKTLASICAEHVHQAISFLKIDVEGHEAAVLRGADLRRWRPTVVVVEATAPHTTEPSHAEWEPLLLRFDYLFAAFDGINRFYVTAERGDLVSLLGAPVTALDGWETHRYLWAREHAEQLQSELDGLRLNLEAERKLRVAAEAALEERLRRSLALPGPAAGLARAVARRLRGRG